MKNIFIVIFLCFTNFIYSQKKEHFIIPDSLKKITFEELETKYKKNSLDDSKRIIYAKVYYKKSKLQNDKIILANGMYMESYFCNNDFIKLKFSDSIIALTQNSNDFNYPAKGYIIKSAVFMKNFDLKQSLINNLIAEKYSIKAGNLELNTSIKLQVALIKIELGKSLEALPLVIDCCNYYKKNEGYSMNYVFSTWVLSDIYLRLNKSEMALSYINNLLTYVKPDNLYYKYLIMYKGICFFNKKEYLKSNDLLNKAIVLIKPSGDSFNLGMCYYYKGENILKNENNIMIAKQYFMKVDSILTISKEYNQDNRVCYLRLIEIVKKQNLDKEQLYYLNKLIDIDKKLKKNDVVISESINKNYDTPHLLAEKEAVISKINSEKYVYISVGLMIFIGLGFTIRNLVKTKKEKKHFEEQFYAIMNQPETAIENEFKKSIDIDAIKTRDFDLPEDLVKDLTKKLTAFEKEKGYLIKELKQSNLAKQFDTNTSYLSKMINHYKGKNFSQYINNLRIEYAIKRLKEEKKYRGYTINSIAEEAGFGNSESFSKAFMEKTGLKPSFFIKKLNELKEETNC